jgi:hypothetical protein
MNKKENNLWIVIIATLLMVAIVKTLRAFGII